MNVKTLTKIFIMAVIALIAVFDVYVWNEGGTEATISWTIFEWSHQYPAFTFLMGFAMGHLFWQMKGQQKLQGGTRDEVKIDTASGDDTDAGGVQQG